MLVYRVMDPRTVSITSVTINTLSFRTMYIRRWWKSKYFMIFFIVNHYLSDNKIKAKNHKQYIFHILSKNDPNLAKTCNFWIFPNNAKKSFFRIQRLGLVQKNYKQIIRNELRKKCEKPPFLAFWQGFRKKLRKVFEKLHD